MNTWLLVCLTAGWIGVGMWTFSAIQRMLRLPCGAQKPLRIYISGPYSHGDREANAWAAIDAADKLMLAGYTPFVPHLTHWWSIRHAYDYEMWMRLDFAFLTVCDAVIRLPGYSPGADREVKMAKEKGIPVYHSVVEFLEERGKCSA